MQYQGVFVTECIQNGIFCNTTKCQYLLVGHINITMIATCMREIYLQQLKVRVNLHIVQAVECVP